MLQTYRGYLFDLDGVITPTVDVHRRAWQETFDALFSHIGASPYQDSDYFNHVDGRPRFEGVSTLLNVRGIELPYGRETDPPGLASVCALGNEKNRRFNEILRRDGIAPYPGSEKLVRALLQSNRSIAIVSSSRNARAVLEAANMTHLFPVIVDGIVARDEALPGKPAPDTYLRAADILDIPASQCVVFEDAISGVEAGKRGNFGLVVGVNRGVGATDLFAAGADHVVNDLQELIP